MSKKNRIESESYSTIGMVSFLIILIWITIFFYSIHRMLPNSPLKLPFSEQIKIEQWLPQTWAFYSRDPRSDLFLAYDENGELAANWPNSSIKNAFGINRHGRSQGIEIGLLRSNISDEDFVECDPGNKNCSDNLISHSVKNPLEYPTICGQIDIVLQEPVPWAWSRKQTIDMPSKIVRLDVSCSID
ncbi:SdpA family antimicrobial peptide system protein [Sediminibacillus halophilus]|uniref:Antimicrobial peptide system protein, SdpA family n=1 Tax=Sediminibacillus halophilus TaxID=482461 RepID=A0A1G9NGX7_9BACI|nr:SdpA family antimicrobial peptide system protein [Sediminibacillus halophilus]SDL85641.1 antimicrobial peptide system protein, SdpA family [Sediminibacillus halophilus]